MKAIDRKLIRDLLNLRGQAIAIALIVACGIACFVALVSAYDSLQLSQATYYDQYRLAHVFDSLKRSPESVAEKIRAIPGVAQVQTRVVVDINLDLPNRKEPVTGRLVSIPERQTLVLNDLYIRQGRYIQANQRDEVLMSEAFAHANHLHLGETIGAVINGRWQRLRIVGLALSPEYVYEIRAGDLFPDNQRFGVMWMGREALGTAFNLKGAFNDVALSLLPRTNIEDVIFRLDKLLEPYGGFGAYSREDQISNRFLSDEIKQLRTSATWVPTIFLSIAVFLLHIVLSRLIGTQRDRIAVLKAFGYSNWEIGWHFLKLVLAIVFLGAAIGISLGLYLGSAMTINYARFFQFPLLRYEPGVVSIGGTLLFSTTAAILGGWRAVQKAISLPPAEAMRPEPPAHFRPTSIEKLGLQRFLSPVGRIILRNLERKPIQAIFSILGIALAVAILVVGFFFTDAMQYMIDVQFRTVQRDDVTLVFNEPRPARTRYEVSQLPGVLYAEPFRSVAAKLRFEHRHRKIGIMGLQSDGELRRLVDRQLHTVNLPQEGMLISSKLGEILRVKPGDLLTVEVLEGARPTRTVPVVGTIDETIGLSAYMDIHSLNRLMREGETISGAFLAVDSNWMDKLYAQLKRTPAVAGVALRSISIQRFQQTIAESIGIATTALLIFAGVIAGGVVYNAARIALSERSRELATLRIIGFSRVQIAVVLLGEQAVLTIAAMPIGLLIGWGLAALISVGSSSELYRFPLYISRSTYALAAIGVALASLISSLIVRRQLDRLDLIAVLKTRE